MAGQELIPGIHRLRWMLVMQPVRLHHRLRKLGIREIDAPGWSLWRQEGIGQPSRRTYARRMLLLLLIAPPLEGLTVAALLIRAGEPVVLDWLGPASLTQLDHGMAALGVSLGVGASLILFLIMATLLGLASGVSMGVCLGVALGVSFGLVGALGPGLPVDGLPTIAHAVSIGTTLGLGFGAGLGVAGSTVRGLTLGSAYTLSEGLSRGLGRALAVGGSVGTAMAIWFSASYDLRAGANLGVSMGGSVAAALLGAFVLFAFRLPIFPLEAALSAALYGVERLTGARTLRWSPVFFHDLAYLPLPLLVSHIVWVARTDPDQARRALDAAARSPGQRRLGIEAMARLQAFELETLARDRDFEALVALEGTWLPGVEGARASLLSLREVARYLSAALAASVPYHQLGHLDRADKALGALDNQLLADRSPAARALASVLPSIQSVAAALRREAAEAASRQIPNPFRAGEPLSPEQGQEVFRGRDALVRQIEGLLGDPRQRCSIALLGPRRCGKTSLLRMLPALLPDAVVVFFDLQDNPVDSPEAFFSALVRQTREAARRDRRLFLPPLPDGPPFETVSRWLQTIDEDGADTRILLCIDEFERLEELFPGDRQQLLQLMGLFRAIIQHRRRVRLLVSGAAPFDELGDLWNDHFINVREITIGHLDHRTAVELLHRPTPDFPGAAISPEVAEIVFARTGGQPFLLQLYGSLLVNRLNREERAEARVEDVAAVEDEVMEQAAYFFRHLFRTAPARAQVALEALALGRPPTMGVRTRRWLVRRCLLSEDNRLQVPVLGAWIREDLGT